MAKPYEDSSMQTFKQYLCRRKNEVAINNVQTTGTDTAKEFVLETFVKDLQLHGKISSSCEPQTSRRSFHGKAISNV